MKDHLIREFRINPSGLVWAYQFHDATTTEISPSDDLGQLLDQHLKSPSGKLLWLHFNLSQASTERWLREHTPLPPEYFEALQQGSRSTRVEQVDDALLAVVNDVLHGFAFDPSETSTLWMYITPTLLISARKKPLKSVDRLRQAVQQGASVTSTTELLTHLLRDQADVLIGIVRDTVTRVDKIEDDLLAGRLDSKRGSLGQLRRVLVRLQRLMAPEPAALFRLLQRPPAWIADDDLQDLRQSSEEFSAVLTDMASLQERIKLLQEEIAAMINERNSKSLYTLTVFTVVALPINLIAGLFGMNVAGIPLAEHPHGFWMVVALILLISGAALWRLLRNAPD
jgi:zinc transporter